MATKTSVARKAAPAPPAPVLAPQNAALATLAQNFSIELAPFADAEKLPAVRSKAMALTAVADKTAHQTALELIKEQKALKRGIEEHWKRITRWLDDRKDDVRAIMNTDLAFLDIDRLGRLCTEYEEDDRRRVAAEQARQRQEQERLAREQRDRELAAMEQQALEAESDSADLSARERAFVQRVFNGETPTLAARASGYQDYEKQAKRLMGLGKITAAIEGMRQAIALREQAKAVSEKPIEVKQVEVQSNLGHVAGTRTVTTWTGECVDYRAFVDALVRGVRNAAYTKAGYPREDGPEVDVETFREMTKPSETGGNAKARALEANLDRIPGWRHIKKVTKAA